MEQSEGSAPVESVEGGDFGGQAMPDAPPWRDSVMSEFEHQLGRHQQEPFEEDYGQAPGFEDAYGDELGPEDAYREDDEHGDDDFDLDEFASQFDPEGGGDDEFGLFGERLADQLGQDQWKQEALSRLDDIEQQVWEDRLDALVEEFPAMERPEVAGPVFESMGAFAREMELPDKVALDPRFARTVYLAMQAERMAARERPAGNGSDVVLEMGGVADPGEPAEGNEFLQLAAEGHRRRNPGRHNPNAPFSWE